MRTYSRTLRFTQSVTAPNSAGMQVCRAGLRWSVSSGGALGLFLLLISSVITTLYQSAPAGPLSLPPSPPASPKISAPWAHPSPHRSAVLAHNRD